MSILDRSRPGHRCQESYGSLLTGGRRYSLRAPRLRDYAGWRDVRLRHADILAPAFGSSERAWADESSAERWFEWVSLLRSRGARHDGVSIAVLVQHRNGGERVIGEFGVCGVDPFSRTGEFYAWAVAGDPAIVRWAAATMVRNAFGAPHRLPRVVGPIAVDNPGPAGALHTMGWSRRGLRRVLREYDARPTDHEIWVLDNDAETRASLERMAR
ncbi:GNAT family N-acetyltransferase [Tsukamurella sp. 1534]|uniref:GNAT family N-acetyltransferase n=1 Tax=Tsukamurella sp. 1534 TaxID=1151061 RepID=UPI0002E6A0B3|nr:hypothetical protein [Tsukamurella sp. 1534]